VGVAGRAVPQVPLSCQGLLSLIAGRPFILLVWWATCLVWSGVWLFITVGVANVPPLSLAGLRLVLALVVLAPFVLARPDAWPRRARDWRLIAVTGILLLGVNYGLVFWAARFIPSGLTAVLHATTPGFGLIFGHFLLKDERFSLPRFGGILLGLAGVALILRDQMGSPEGAAAIVACLAVVAAAVSVALAYMLLKRYGTHIDTTVLTMGQMAAAVGPLLLAAVVIEGLPRPFEWPRQAIVALLYLALGGSVLAFWLNYWLLKRMTASEVLAMSLVEPLLAALLGAAFLSETLAPLAIAGGCCILVSVWLLLRRPLAAPLRAGPGRVS
jgi:drug/metabolite transporter (DMT)-like permease